jgi:hypothetical protein
MISLVSVFNFIMLARFKGYLTLIYIYIVLNYIGGPPPPLIFIFYFLIIRGVVFVYTNNGSRE